ncbi:Ig-like domain-containing protein [Undibacterium sp. MH2W]|uniref:Ig-like domain-containing protein n=1 Tax=Undibacterium sp. MH2W TaxID=3413044 RepID=UPI003BF42A8C
MTTQTPSTTCAPAPTIVINTPSGTVKNGGITNDATPIISGTGVPGDTITIKDGNTVLGTVVVASNGTWTLTLKTALPNGLQTITATQIGKTGSSSTAASTSFTVDTIADSAPTVTITNPTTNGALNSASLGSSGLINLQIGIPKDASVGDILTVVDQAGNKITQTLTSANINAGSIVLTGLFKAPASGSTFTVTATLTDLAGNVSVPGKASDLIETTPPATPGAVVITTPKGSVNNGGITNVATPVISGTGVAGDTVTVKDGNTVLGTAVVAANGTWSLSLTKALADGIHNISVTQTDSYGNSSAASTISFTTDTVADSAPTISITNPSTNGVLNIASLGSSGLINLQITIPKDASVGDTLTVVDQAGNKVVQTLTSANIAAGSVTLTGLFTAPASGSTFTVTATLTDLAGNVSTAGSVSELVETTPPATPGAVVITTPKGSVNNGGITNVATPVISGTGVAGDTVTVTDGTTVLGTVVVAANGTWSLSLTKALADGTHNISVTQTDGYGNSSAASTISFTSDTVADSAPTVSITNPSTNGVLNIASLGSSGLINLQIGIPKDASVGDTLTVVDQAGNKVVQTLTSANIAAGSVTLTGLFTAPASGSTFTVTATLTDLAGNVSTAGSVSELVETTAPSTPGTVVITTPKGSVPNGGYTNITTPTFSGTGVAGDTITVKDGNTVLGTVVVAANGTWSLALTTPLTDGTHNISVTQTDGYGNSSAASTISFTSDTVADSAPTVSITNPSTNGVLNIASLGSSGLINLQISIPKDASVGDTLTIVDQAGNKVVQTLTSANIAAGSVVLNGLFTAPASGSTFTVTATLTDLAGNVSTAGSVSELVETTPPATPGAVSITTPNGSVPNGGYTNVTKPTFSGTGVAGDTVTVKDGNTVLGTAVVAANGTWSLTLTTPLTDGTHNISVTQTDGYGNSSAASTISFTSDTVADSAPTVSITNPSTNGVLNIASLGTSGLINLQISIPKDASVGDTLTVVDQAGNKVTQVLTAANIAAGSVTLTGLFTAPASGSTFTVTATLTDLAGNVSTAGSVSELIETTPPSTPGTVSITTPKGSIPNGGYTNVTTPTFSGTGVAGDTITVKDGNTVLGTAVVAANGTWSLTLTTPLTDGTHNISVTQTDGYGNSSAASTISFTSDTVADSAPTVSITNSSTNGVLNIASLGTTGLINLQISIPKDASVGDTLTVVDQAGNKVTQVLTAANIATGSVTLTGLFTAPASGSTFTVTATLTDLAGNVSTAGSVSEIVETTPPATPGAVSITTPNGSVPNGGYTNITTPTFSGTGVAGDVVTVKDGNTVLGTTVVAANGTWSLSLTKPLTDGTHNISVTQTDGYGNSSAASTISFTSDTVADSAPTVSVTNPSNNGVLNIASLGTSGLINLQISIPKDASVGDTLTVVDQAGNKVVQTLTSANIAAGSVTLTGLFTAPASGSTFTVTATLTDLAGNVSNAGSVSELVETTPPATPGAVSITTPNGSVPNGGYTNITTPTFIGTGVAGDVVTVKDGNTVLGTTVVAANGTWSLSLTKALADGTHNISVTQTDGYGNSSAASTISFTSDTVADSAPTVSITNPSTNGVLNIASLGTSGLINLQISIPKDASVGDTLTVVDQAGNKVTQVLTAANIAAGSVTLTGLFTAPASGSTFTVTATLTDLAGNVSTAGSVSELVETTPPSTPGTVVITTPKGSVPNGGYTNITTPTFSGTGVAGDTVTVKDGNTVLGTAVVAANGTWSLTLTTPLTDGTHNISVTQTDGYGNSSAASTISFTSDTVADSAPTVSVINPSNNGVLNIASLGSSGLINLQIGIQKDASVGDTLTVVDQAGNKVTQTLTAANIAAGSVILTGLFKAPASGSTFTATATLTDLAGNVSVAGSISELIETNAPSAPTLVVTGPYGAIPNGNITEATTPVISGTGIAGDTITISDNGIVLGSTVVSSNGTWTFNESTPLSLGTQNISVTQTDNYGNVSNAASTSFSVSNTTIAITQIQTPSQPASVSTIFDSLTEVTEGVWGQSITTNLFTAQTSGAYLSVQPPYISNSNPILIFGSPNGNRTANSFQVTSKVGAFQSIAFDYYDSSYFVSSYITFYNAQGTIVAQNSLWNSTSNGNYGHFVINNLASATYFVITTITQNENVGIFNITANVQLPPVSGITISNGTNTNTTTPVISGTISQSLVSGEVVEIYRNGVAVGQATVSGTNWTFTDNITAGAAAAYTAKILDNGSTVIASNGYAINEAPGAVVITTPQGKVPNGGITNDATPVISGTGIAGDTININDGNTLLGTVVVASNGTWSLSLTTPLADGTHNINVTQTDTYGNVSVASTISFTTDTVADSAPTVSVTNPSNNGVLNIASLGSSGLINLQIGIQKDASVGDTLTVVDQAGNKITQTLTAANIAAGKVILTGLFKAPASGSTFTATATLTDSAGNVSVAGSISELIETNAPSAPTLVVTDQFGNVPNGNVTETTTPVFSGTGVAGDTINITDNGIVLGSTVVSSNGTWTFNESTPLSLGTQNISVTQTDNYGNVSNAASTSFSVTNETVAITQVQTPSTPWLATVETWIEFKSIIAASGSIQLSSAAIDTQYNYYSVTSDSRAPDPFANSTGSYGLPTAGLIVYAGNNTFVSKNGPIKEITINFWEPSITNTSVVTFYDASGKVIKSAALEQTAVLAYPPFGTANGYWVNFVDNNINGATSFTISNTANFTLSNIVTNTGGPGITISDGTNTTTTTPVISGTISQNLLSGEIVEVYRNGVAVGQASVSGDNWTFTDNITAGAAAVYTASILDNGATVVGSTTYTINALSHKASSVGGSSSANSVTSAPSLNSLSTPLTVNPSI